MTKMSAELLFALDELEKEKGIDKEIIQRIKRFFSSMKNHLV